MLVVATKTSAPEARSDRYQNPAKFNSTVPLLYSEPLNQKERIPEHHASVQHRTLIPAEGRAEGCLGGKNHEAPFNSIHHTQCIRAGT